MATTVTAAITLLLPAGRCARPCHRQNGGSIHLCPQPGLGGFGGRRLFRGLGGIPGRCYRGMLLVQAVDGCVGLWEKSLPRAAGPFLMALLHGAGLLALLPLL